MPGPPRHLIAHAVGQCQRSVGRTNGVERSLIDLAPHLPPESGVQLNRLIDEARSLAGRHKRLADAIKELFADALASPDPLPPAEAMALLEAAA